MAVRKNGLPAISLSRGSAKAERIGVVFDDATHDELPALVRHGAEVGGEELEQFVVGRAGLQPPGGLCQLEELRGE